MIAADRPARDASRVTTVLLGLSVVVLGCALPILMVVSNRSAVATITAAAGLALVALVWERRAAGLWRDVLNGLRRPASLAAMAFLAWTLISIAWTSERGAAFSEWAGSLALPLAAAAVLATTVSQRVPRWAPAAMAASVFIAGVAICIEIRFDYVLGHLVDRSFGGGQRLRAEFFNRPTLTLLVLFWPLLAILRAHGHKLMPLVLFTLVVMTISISHSGTALVTMFASILVYAAAQAAPRLCVRVGIAAILASFVIAPFIGVIAGQVPESAYSHLHAMRNQGFSASTRVELWKSFGAVVSHHPIIGTGFGSSRFLADGPAAGEIEPQLRPTLHFNHPHNNYLQIWVETGAIGAILAALFAAALFRRAWRDPLSVSPAACAFVATTALIAGISHGAWQAWWIATVAAAACTLKFGDGDDGRPHAPAMNPRGLAVVFSWPWRTLAIRSLAFLHDVVLTGAGFMLALLLRLGLKRFLIGLHGFWWPTALIMAIAAISGPMFGLNSGVWRYASLSDLRGIVGAVTVAIMFFVIGTLFLPGLDVVPRSVPPAAWFIIIVLLAAPRIAYRLWKSRLLDSTSNAEGRKRVLLLGAGDEAEIFIREANERRGFGYDVVGVIDERGRRVGQTIRGVAILGKFEEIPEVLTRLRWAGTPPEHIVVTSRRSTFAADRIEQLLALIRDHDVSVLRLPDIGDLRGNPASAIRPEPISIDDLLYRDPVKLDLDGIQQFILGTRLIVTGGGGSIGSELCLQLASLRPRQVTIIDHSETLLYTIDRKLRTAFPELDVQAFVADVRDRAHMMRLVRQIGPDFIFHAAALKHVPIVEAQPSEGVATNALGTRNVADAAIAAGALAMVMISTDKAINPTNVMGASKRLAELYCQALDMDRGTRFVTVRFGNVLGSAGSVVPLFQEQIATGGPITVTHPDVQRYFLTILEAVQLVLQAANHGTRTAHERGAIFVLGMGSPVKITDLAEKMVRLSGLRLGEDIKVVFTGLRPGEKLYEEIFGANEPPVATSVDGVLVASPNVLPRARVADIYDRVERLVEQGEERAVVELLIDTIAEYRPDPRLLHRLGLDTDAHQQGEPAHRVSIT